MKNFIKSLQRPDNKTLIEAILEGYSVIFEASVTAQFKQLKDRIPLVYEASVERAEKLLSDFNDLTKFDAGNRYNPNGLKKWLILKGSKTNVNTEPMKESMNFLQNLITSNEDATKKMWNNFGNDEFSLSNLYDLYHQNLKKESEKKQKEERIKLAQSKEYAGNKTVLSFPDGFKWVTNPKGFCEIEAELMGHCGNKPSVKNGDTLYSLRDKDNIPYLTFIVNNQIGNLNVLGESKGRGNDKPSDKYHKYIVPFLIKFIDYIRGGGYEPEHNFEFMDLSKSDRTSVKSQKPYIDDMKDLIINLKDEKSKIEVLKVFFNLSNIKGIKDNRYVYIDSYDSLSDLYDVSNESGDNYVRLLDLFEDYWPDIEWDDYLISYISKDNMIKIIELAKVPEDEIKEFIEEDEDIGREIKSKITRAADEGYKYGAEAEAYKDVKSSLETVNDYGFFVKMNGNDGLEVYFDLNQINSAYVNDMKDEIEQSGEAINHFWDWNFRSNSRGYDGFDKDVFNESLSDSLHELDSEIKANSRQV